MERSLSEELPPPLKLPPVNYGSMRLPSRFLLSPLAGYTTLSFRLIVREIGGVGLVTTDLVNARGLIEGNRRSRELVETSPADRPLAVQLFGDDPYWVCEAARFLEARGVDSIDINMGCPVDHVTKTGAGASLMCRPGAAFELVSKVVSSVKIPVTVKMRLGWDDQNITAPEFARQFERAGVAAVAIHGRTRAQGFSGTVSREGIRRVVDTVERIPVIGNGDIRNIADAHRMLTETGCAGISIGRGALANPWIFQQLVAWETTGESCTGGTFSDRMGLLRKQYQFLEDRHGAERAIPVFRKMAHWYLKSMRVPAWLRDEFQTARTRSELDLAIQHIEEYGPRGAGRDEALPDMQIPVPSGPNALW